MPEYRQAPLLGLPHRFPGTEKAETWIEQQLLALAFLFGNVAGDTIKQWLPVLLNQRPDLLAIIGLDADLSLSEAFISRRMDAVLNVMAWDEHQKLAIERSPKLNGHIGILEGAPGCGKTVTLAGKALLYAALGFAVLLLSELRKRPILCVAFSSLSISRSGLNLVSNIRHSTCSSLVRTPMEK